MNAKRFRVAFSFAGEKRDYVSKVAAILAQRFGEDNILYDKFHESEFARYDLGTYLPKLYREQSELIVAVVCPAYDSKLWTGWEWMAIHAQLSKPEGSRIVLCRFENASVEGLYENAGFIELDQKTPDQAAILILERLALNEGKPKPHYLSDGAAIGQFPPSPPGFWPWLFDKYAPWVYRMWRRWFRNGQSADPPGARAYLEDFRARMANDLREKTYVPVDARSVSQTVLDDAPPDDPFLWPVHAYIRELVGDAAGGDSANAQIAAVNRRSRLVRNLLRKLDRAKRPLILLGDPGSGKTMTLQQAALVLAERELGRAFPLIPVYVRLGDFHVHEGPVTPEHVMAHVRRSLPSALAQYADRLAEDGRLVIFFDGMDEMSRNRYNDHTEALSVFASRYSQQRDVLVGVEGTKTLYSCRITDFSPKFIHERLVLLPFDRRQIREFLHRYLKAFPIEIEGQMWSLSALSEYLVSPSITVDATNPFALWLLCVYLRGQRKWPGSRVEMLRFYNRFNYERKNEELRKSGESPLARMDETFLHWGIIAFEISSRNRGGSIPIAALALGDDQQIARQAIDAGKLCGVLRESKEQHEHLLRFNHHRFQEYFTALYIDKVGPEILWLDKLDAPRWQETMFNLILMGSADDVVKMFARELARLLNALQIDGALDRAEVLAPTPEAGTLRGLLFPEGLVFSGPALEFDSETILADRVEMAARILKQKSDRSGILREILRFFRKVSPFLPTVCIRHWYGRDIAA